MSDKSVAIVGFGVSGISAARWCKKEGLSISVFEKRFRSGGIWSPDTNNPSPIWKQLHLNTPGFFSHLTGFPPERDTKFVRHDVHQHYLESYANHHDLTQHVRFGAVVESARRNSDGCWSVIWTDSDGQTHTEVFDHVIVATGQFSGSPVRLDVPVDKFSGKILYSYDIWDLDDFRGKNVVVAGYGNTGVELAVELAHRAIDGSRTIISSRAPRDVMGKYLNGRPSELELFNRFAGHLAQVSPPEEMTQALADMLHSRCGRGETDYGGMPRPSDLMLGWSICEGFSHSLNEGKIVEREAISKLDGSTVHFADGRSEADVDVILVCYGYEFSASHLFPFLSERAQRDLEEGGNTSFFFDLDRFTWSKSPELEGLAFVGMNPTVGGVTGPFELNARWVAYVFSGAVPAPTPQEIEAGIKFCRMYRLGNKVVPSSMLYEMFARGAGVAPSVAKYPQLAWSLTFGPIFPEDFLLEGRDADPQSALAQLQIFHAYRCGGKIPTVPSASQMAGLQMVQEKLQTPMLIDLIALFKELAKNPDAIVASD